MFQKSYRIKPANKRRLHHITAPVKHYNICFVTSLTTPDPQSGDMRHIR